jgi:transposase-like protein
VLAPPAWQSLRDGQRPADVSVSRRRQPRPDIDFLLSAKRDAKAVKRFFRRALAQLHTVDPRTITVDKNAAYPKATAKMKKDGELWCCSRLRQVKCPNNIIEQDHWKVKRQTCPGLWLWQLLDR